MESEGFVPSDALKMKINKEGSGWRTESSRSVVNTAAAGV